MQTHIVERSGEKDVSRYQHNVIRAKDFREANNKRDDRIR